MISSSGGLVGFLDSLETLHEVFTDDRQQSKLFDLSAEFAGWRRCKGDGNCFYRACGFAVVESLALSAPKRLAPLGDLFRKLADGEAPELVNLLARLPSMDQHSAIEAWYKALLTDPVLDHQLVRVVRLAAASWLEQHQHAAFKRMPIESYVESEHRVGFARFLQTEVLGMGKEADDLMIHAAAAALAVRLEIVQVDRTAGAALRHVLPEDSHGEPTAALLFRPGHYDIFYRRGPFRELSQLEEQMQIRGQCCGQGGPPGVDDLFGSRADGRHKHRGSPTSGRGDGMHLAPGAVPRGISQHDSAEDAISGLKAIIRESVSRCVEKVEREADELRHAQLRIREDEAACTTLEGEVTQLSLELTKSREYAQRLEDNIHRLKHGGTFWCCASPPPRTTEFALHEAIETTTRPLSGVHVPR